MNKNVFNYLNGKAQDVTNYIKTKAESAGNYLSEHAKQIKNGAIKATATALTAATLLGGATGCNLIGGNSADTMFPIVSVKDPDTIKEQGITAQDVLDVYDDLSLKYLYTYFVRNIDKVGDDWDNISAKFDKITVNRQNYPTSDDWLAKSEEADDPFYYNLNLGGNNNNDYYTCLYYDGALKSKLNSITENNVPIPKEQFEDLMKAFNVKSFEVTDEYWKERPLVAGMFNDITGFTVYEPFEFSRDVISNANEEQLWALYDAGIAATDIVENFLESFEDYQKLDK